MAAHRRAHTRPVAFTQTKVPAPLSFGTSLCRMECIFRQTRRCLAQSPQGNSRNYRRICPLDIFRKMRPPRVCRWIPQMRTVGTLSYWCRWKKNRQGTARILCCWAWPGTCRARREGRPPALLSLDTSLCRMECTFQRTRRCLAQSPQGISRNP